MLKQLLVANAAQQQANAEQCLPNVTLQRNMEYQLRNPEAQITTMREATEAQIKSLTEVVPSLF